MIMRNWVLLGRKSVSTTNVVLHTKRNGVASRESIHITKNLELSGVLWSFCQLVALTLVIYCTVTRFKNTIKVVYKIQKHIAILCSFWTADKSISYQTLLKSNNILLYPGGWKLFLDHGSVVSSVATKFRKLWCWSNWCAALVQACYLVCMTTTCHFPGNWFTSQPSIEKNNIKQYKDYNGTIRWVTCNVFRC
jgi:hypothetical protein